MGYNNFDVAVYCSVREAIGIAEHPELEKEFDFFSKHVQISKVYLETYRGKLLIERDQIIKAKQFFTQKGIRTSGGITTDVSGGWEFKTFCYTNQEQMELLQKVVRFTAELFDEIIFDDFFFTNCKCESCIRAKGNRSWSEFRTELLRKVSDEIIVKTAKQVNPNVTLIIKYPNWYEEYQNTGYNLADEPKLFDKVYTGTETRDPNLTQQTLQRYTSYFIMRYLENVKPGCNGGGWFDSFDCAYNLGSYAEQSYLTLFAKAREVTMFSIGSLIFKNPVFIPIAGFTFEKVDQFVGLLGNPLGIAAYKPYHSYGENYLHGYLGMLGLPLEPTPVFPEESNLLLLTESAGHDPEIVNRIKKQLQNGKEVVITSGLLKVLAGRGIEEVIEIRYTDRKVAVDKFAYPMYECSFGNYFDSPKIIIPQIESATNDCIQSIVAFADGKVYPILLKAKYGSGVLYVLTIPDHFGDIYNYPAAVLDEIRRILSKDIKVTMEGPGQVGLFVYDNDTFIVESFLPYHTDVKISVKSKNAELVDLVTGKKVEGLAAGDKTEFQLKLGPASYQVYSFGEGNKIIYHRDTEAQEENKQYNGDF